MTEETTPIAPLRSTLERPLDVASNRPGAAGGGTLAYLVPDLAPAGIEVIGQPDEAVLDTLRRLAGEGGLLVRESVASGPPAGAEQDPAVAWLVGTAGLEAIATGAATATGAHTGATEQRLARASAVIVDGVGQTGAERARAGLAALGFETTILSTLVTDGLVTRVEPGEADLAIPAPSMVEGGAVQATLRRAWQRVRGRHAPRTAPGRAVLAGHDDPHLPPAWARRLLATAGLDGAAYTWSLASPGRYDTQKLLLRLRHSDPADQPLIVKLTRDARHADRLATEAAALQALAAMGPLEGVIVPRLVAAGPVGRSFAAVETLIDGRPLPPILRATGDGLVDAPVDALISLATASVRAVPGTALAGPLGRLLERYLTVYAATMAERDLLEHLLGTIGEAPNLPIVAQHGDPGTWNLLLAPDGRIGLLDWESFEPDGPPLWDLWHLVRSITLDLDPGWLPGRRLAYLTDAFLETGRANDRIVRATGRYRAAVPVDDRLILPLLLFGFLHRTLKESTRMAPGKVGDGHYARFLRRLLARPDAPGLRRLTGARDPG